MTSLYINSVLKYLYCTLTLHPIDKHMWRIAFFFVEMHQLSFSWYLTLVCFQVDSSVYELQVSCENIVLIVFALQLTKEQRELMHICLVTTHIEYMIYSMFLWYHGNLLNMNPRVMVFNTWLCMCSVGDRHKQKFEFPCIYLQPYMHTCTGMNYSWLTV